MNDSRLARRLNLSDAIFLGLGSMIGAGVFAAAAPAAEAAGSGLLIGILIAAVIAFLNATTMAQLAAIYPESGGTYVYGRKRLGNFWGFLAGWGFVIGKLASCTAMALTFAYYAAPAFAQPLAISAVLILTTINCLGIHKTAFVTKVIVCTVLLSLLVIVFAASTSGTIDINRLSGWTLHSGVSGILQSAGILFFAFAGYARIATLGEEVIEPRTTIPKAIVFAFGITFCVYLLVFTSAILTVDITELASAKAPLSLVVESSQRAPLVAVTRLGACLASMGVLLSLMAGISRTIFSMASNADLPSYFSAIHPKRKVPHRAEIAVGGIVAAVLIFADLRGAIGFSSFAILIYYAIANVASFTLPHTQRLWPRWMSVAGFLGCVVVACYLPLTSVIGGAIVFSIGALLYKLLR